MGGKIWERNKGEVSWEVGHGGGITGEESLKRNPGGGIMEKESWQRNYGGNTRGAIMEEESILC